MSISGISNNIPSSPLGLQPVLTELEAAHQQLKDARATVRQKRETRDDLVAKGALKNEVKQAQDAIKMARAERDQIRERYVALGGTVDRVDDNEEAPSTRRQQRSANDQQRLNQRVARSNLNTSQLENPITKGAALFLQTYAEDALNFLEDCVHEYNNIEAQNRTKLANENNARLRRAYEAEHKALGKGPDIKHSPKTPQNEGRINIFRSQGHWERQESIGDPKASLIYTVGDTFRPSEGHVEGEITTQRMGTKIVKKTECIVVDAWDTPNPQPPVIPPIKPKETPTPLPPVISRIKPEETPTPLPPCVPCESRDPVDFASRLFGFQA